ncbi:GNAT family N-acetyltransferase [Peribacillus frigoritolerans]|nr:GNAT family N-acetyltransferase [Peribacillus frigoritolerans]
MFPILETKRLVFRELVEGDAADLLKCFSNPDVLRYYGQTPLTNADQVKANHSGIFQRVSKKTMELNGELNGKEKEGIIGTIGFQEWSHEHKKGRTELCTFPKILG